MRLYDGLREFVPPPGGTVLSIGNFDGVHRGHARLVAAARELAHERRASVTALTFHPHPLAILAPERAPTPLTTLAEKLVLLERLGVADGIVLKTDRTLLAQRRWIPGEHGGALPAAGTGRGPGSASGMRSGSIATLRSTPALGLRGTRSPGGTLRGPPADQSAISSSSIRGPCATGASRKASTQCSAVRIALPAGSGRRTRGQARLSDSEPQGVSCLVPEAVYVAIACVPRTERTGGGQRGPSPRLIPPRCRRAHTCWTTRASCAGARRSLTWSA
jgi:hypothetical protein